MTEQPEWNCGHCGEPAKSDDYIPYCVNPACPFNGSIIPNFIH